MATQKKIDTVKDLTEKIEKSKAVYVVDYRGLKNKQLQELRKTLKPIASEFVITKNRLLKLALGNKASAFEKALTDTTATLFTYADEIAPLKAVINFFKTAGMGRTKAGLLGENPIAESDLARLSTLPTRQVLLATLVRQLNSPIQGLHYALQWNLNRLVWALNAVQDKKS